MTARAASSLYSTGLDQRKLLIRKTKSENSGRLKALEAYFWRQKRSSKDENCCTSKQQVL
jgi:hypothetical protein